MLGYFRRSLTHFADDVDRAGVQHVEQSGSEAVSPVFRQPALTWKIVLDTFGWHGNRKLIHQPAALWCDAVMAELRGTEEEGEDKSRNGYIIGFCLILAPEGKKLIMLRENGFI